MKSNTEETEVDSETAFSLRFKAFLEEYKINVSKLASKINEGKGEGAIKNDRVKFGRWLKGTEPGFEGLAAIAKHYDVNMNWLISGTGEMRLGDEGENKDVSAMLTDNVLPYPAIPPDHEIVPKATMELMRNTITNQQGQIEVLQDQVTHVNGFADGFKQIALNFPKSGSHTTVVPMPQNAIGFEIGTQEKPKGKVLMHPAMTGSLIVLNSLSNQPKAQG